MREEANIIIKNLDNTQYRVRDIIRVLGNALDESNEDFEKHRDRNYIIGYLQGYIKSEMQELASIRDEIRNANLEIQYLLEDNNIM